MVGRIQYDKYGNPYEEGRWFTTREAKEINDFCHRQVGQVFRFMHPYEYHPDYNPYPEVKK